MTKFFVHFSCYPPNVLQNSACEVLRNIAEFYISQFTSIGRRQLARIEKPGYELKKFAGLLFFASIAEFSRPESVS